MLKHRPILASLPILMLYMIASVALADKIVLKDGRVLEGLVIKQADQYWVKTPDGESRLIPESDVVSVTKGAPKSITPPTPVVPKTTASPATPTTAKPVAPAPLGKPTAAVQAIEKKAIDAEKASDVISIWKDFIDSKPASAADLQYARDQLAKWTDIVANTGAEKIEGKWIIGDEYKSMMEKAKGLFQEGMTALQKNETIKGLAKLEEAQKVYPNSFHINFILGFFAFNQGNLDNALPLFQKAQKIRPDSAEAATNIGVIYFKNKDYERAILQVQHAAEMADSPEITYNLNAVIYLSPPAIQSSAKVKPAIGVARLLASKYNLPNNIWRGRGPLPVPYRDKPSEGGGGMASGTGFIITSDGLILTNRHVVKDGKSFQVLVQDQKLPGEVVLIDDEQDLAILRVKFPKPLSTVQFSDRDAPVDGAECTVIGFPLIDRIGGSPKVTHGIVTSSMKTAQDGADVLTDAKVNPGNSGGPILDKSGNVMAIVCMKTLSSEAIDTYGMGISAGKIRKFLEKNKIQVQRAKSSVASLSVEDIATKIEPVTVLILSVH